MSPAAVPIARGRDADVYAVDDDWVLRRYRNGGDVETEAAVMRHVAEHGFPVPHVRSAIGTDIVMRRLRGPTLLAGLMSLDVTVEAGAGVMAALHERLHRIEWPGGGGVVVHFDLHPDNIVMCPDGPMLIDWSNARCGPAELDVALSALILAQVATDPAIGPLAASAGQLLGAFLAVVDDPAPGLDGALAARRRNPTMSDAELAGLDAAAELVLASRP
ncbi:MAG: serine/threonine protein phosphatase [Pseudonocardiales bacterium]|nr:MAG: serine/threonine protein phosphatase [Pseudonocardiales bacterium]